MPRAVNLVRCRARTRRQAGSGEQKQAPQKGGASLRQQMSGCQARESRDSPRLKAFWRVAPSVHFNVLAMMVGRARLPL